MAEFLAIQHVEPEEPGTIERAVRLQGHSVARVQLFEDDPIPEELGDYRGLIVMGGPMGVHDVEEHPALRHEKALIASAIEADRPVLGVCLGAQLIADVLGATVEPGAEPEIGWYPIERTEAGGNDPVLGAAPEQLTAFHWHGDVFELPDGATHLARSARTEHQAFRYGSTVYGLLFHLEVNRPIIVDMIEAFYEDLENPAEDAASIVRTTRHHVEALEEAGEQVFGRWVDRATNA